MEPPSRWEVVGADTNDGSREKRHGALLVEENVTTNPSGRFVVFGWRTTSLM